jgi:NifU-like protein
MSKPGAAVETVTIEFRKSSIRSLAPSGPPPKKPPKLSNIQKIKLIEETLEREKKTALQKDGGGIELVDVDGNTVMVRLCGTCSACSASQVTLKNYVETKLQELVTPELVVEEVA